jgi:hypothetical protein
VLVENNRRWLCGGFGRPIPEARDDCFDGVVFSLKVDPASLTAEGYKMPRGGNCSLSLSQYVTCERKGKNVISLDARSSLDDRWFVLRWLMIASSGAGNFCQDVTVRLKISGFQVCFRQHVDAI